MQFNFNTLHIYRMYSFSNLSNNDNKYVAFVFIRLYPFHCEMRTAMVILHLLYTYYLYIYWWPSMLQNQHTISIGQSFIHVIISIHNNECISSSRVVTLLASKSMFHHHSLWWLDYFHFELRLKFISNPISFRNWVKVDITKCQ